MDARKIFELRALLLAKQIELVKDQPEELRGRAREALIQDFLEPLLPDALGIDGGTIISAKQKEGIGELDVIIYDKQAYKIFKPFADYMPKKSKPFPTEVVYAVIEVENYLTESAVEKIALKCTKLKELSKTAFYEQTGAIIHTVKLYGKEFSSFPTLFILFAYDSQDLVTIFQKLKEVNSKNNHPLENQIDLICVMNKGLVVHHEGKTGLLHFPAEPGCELRYRVGAPEENLRLLYLMMMRILTQVWTRPIKVMDYFEDQNEKS